MSEQWIQALEQDPGFRDRVVSWTTIPPKEGSYEDIPDSLHPKLQEVLRGAGFSRLYAHQAESFRRVSAGESICLVTPTASGKSLAYNLPVLDAILRAPETRALYLFPTKALSQDQQAALNEVSLSGLGVKIATFDGDTPVSLRASVKQNGQIVISNPDMLHSGILPNHPKWISFLRNLRFVVIDELHSYRGVFGSHLANLLIRLRRVLNFYGADPVFICCSATIGNPLELARKITGKQIHLVDKNGAPSGEKHVISYNPPLVDAVQGIRKGTVNEGQAIAIRLLTAGIKTIVFARSRVRVELIAGYINKRLANIFTDNRKIRVESYRGGYLPSERRAIEKGLRDGSIQGVVSTNALELGIDIGGLDAAVLAGYPGSIASVWQQAGRAGRSGSPSVAILIAGANPLDQYMITHPEYFESRPPEQGFINPENPFIRTDHIRCAAFELPFAADEDYFPDAKDYLDLLTEDGTLRETRGSYYWAGRGYPAESVSLRSASNENVVIINQTGGKFEVIGEMDRPGAKELLFPRAVYLHRGNQFMVRELDLEERRAYVEESDVNYYTDAITKTDLKVLIVDQEPELGSCTAALGDVLVRTQVAKFKKLKFHSHENIGYGDIHLPEEEMHTRSVCLRFGPETPAGSALAEMDPEQITGAVSRLGYLIRQVAPAFLLCDPGDIRTAERLKDPYFEVPALYVYDAYPGGTGLSEAFIREFAHIAGAARDRIDGCGCAEGCPSCIGARDMDRDVTPNPKPDVLRLVRALDVRESVQ